ncbi:MAG: COQ9 family protein [Albidovulum sp.]|nr:COQ9 family protein [Albidovulum sp.]
MPNESSSESMISVRRRLLSAALPDVAFDGWCEDVFSGAVEKCELDPLIARAACPRGHLDLAVAFHREGDDDMCRILNERDHSHLRYSEKVAAAVVTRLEAVEHNKDAVRKGIALFSLPHLAPEGTRLLWGTADRIWSSLGDRSDDINWYSKRAILASVYASALLIWIRDFSESHSETAAFVDRRIGDVMRFESAKTKFRSSRVGSYFQETACARFFESVKAPRSSADDLPGRMKENSP